MFVWEILFLFYRDFSSCIRVFWSISGCGVSWPSMMVISRAKITLWLTFLRLWWFLRLFRTSMLALFFFWRNCPSILFARCKLLSIFSSILDSLSDGIKPVLGELAFVLFLLEINYNSYVFCYDCYLSFRFIFSIWLWKCKFISSLSYCFKCCS